MAVATAPSRRERTDKIEVTNELNGDQFTDYLDQVVKHLKNQPHAKQIKNLGLQLTERDGAPTLILTGDAREYYHMQMAQSGPLHYNERPKELNLENEITVKYSKKL